MDKGKTNNYSVKDIIELQQDVIGLRETIPAKLKELIDQETNLIIKCHKDSLKKNVSDKSTEKFFNKQYFENHFLTAPQLPDFSEKLVTLNSRIDDYLKIQDFYKKN